MTAGPRGPILLQDVQFLDEMSHFDRERIPERVVHAKGGGAFGYFEVTHDVTKYCKAKIFDKIGKKTPCLVRFSTVGKWIYQTRHKNPKLILVSLSNNSSVKEIAQGTADNDSLARVPTLGNSRQTGLISNGVMPMWKWYY